MAKVDFTILKKKKFGLPVWAWALILALSLYLVYRHSKNNPPADTTPATTPDPTGATSPGDLTSGGSTNAGNTQNATGSADLGDNGLQNNIDAVKGQIQDFTDALGVDSANLASAHDASQNQDPTAQGSDTTTPAADLGLTHITGAYWWDTTNHKLVKIPGSGGVKPGSGKKKKPNTTKAGGKKPKPKKKAKLPRHLKVKPPHLTVHKKIPKPAPHQKQLTPKQRAAIDRAHHPEPKRPVVKKPAVHRTIRPPVKVIHHAKAKPKPKPKPRHR